MAMLNHYMSKEDVLDILFANRNKAYGAYLLRREYPSRLKKSMVFMLGGVLLLGAGLEWKSVHQGPPVVPSIFKPYIEVTLQPPPKLPKPIEHPLLRPATPHPAVQPAVPPAPTIASTDINLVDNPKPDHIVPPQTDLASHEIGVTTTNGPGNAGLVSTSPGTAAGNGATQTETDEGIFKSVEQMPMFPGGEEALRKYLMRNMETPDELEEGSQKRVVVRFVVDKDGTISACAVMQSAGDAYDQEVLRVVKHMPKWKPGIQNGRPVPVYFTLPVVFARN
jgi:periplasmic protein TonB